MKYYKVKSIEDFNNLLNQDQRDFVIANGVMKSSKYITYDGTNKYYIFNFIDDSEDEMSKKDLLKSNIGRAIKNGTFYCEIDYDKNIS